MANTVDKVRVQNAILGLLQAGPYYAVTYSPTTKFAENIDTASATPITPASAVANEKAATFEIDQRHRRDLKFDRTSWAWVGIVKFNREVTAHAAEEAWSTDPLVLPRSTGDDPFRQATIHLIASSYQHPIKQGGYSGSLIEFSFEIRVSRR